MSFFIIYFVSIAASSRHQLPNYSNHKSNEQLPIITTHNVRVRVHRFSVLNELHGSHLEINDENVSGSRQAALRRMVSSLSLHSGVNVVTTACVTHLCTNRPNCSVVLLHARKTRKPNRRARHDGRSRSYRKDKSHGYKHTGVIRLDACYIR